MYIRGSEQIDFETLEQVLSAIKACKNKKQLNSLRATCVKFGKDAVIPWQAKWRKANTYISKLEAGL